MRFLEKLFPNFYNNIAEPSRWARRGELKEYLAPSSPDEREGRIPLGKIGSKIVAAKDEQSVLVFGPTGSGKTQGVVIPAMLEWQGPIISTCVKRDLVDRTLAERQQHGPVYIFDPSRVTSYDSARWSPLSVCKTWNDSLDMAKWLINASPTSRDEGKDRTFWMANAQNLLAPLLYASAKADKTMGQVADWIDEHNMQEPAGIIFETIHKAEGKLELMSRLPDLQEKELPLSQVKDQISDEIEDMKKDKEVLLQRLDWLKGNINPRTKNRLKENYTNQLEQINQAIIYTESEGMEDDDVLPELKNPRLDKMNQYRMQLHTKLLLVDEVADDEMKKAIKKHALEGLEMAKQAKTGPVPQEQMQEIDAFEKEMKERLALINGTVSPERKTLLRKELTENLDETQTAIENEVDSSIEKLEDTQKQLQNWISFFDGTITNDTLQKLQEDIIDDLSSKDTVLQKATGGLELIDELLTKSEDYPTPDEQTEITEKIKTEKQDAEMAINKFRSIPNLPDDTRGSAYGVVNSILDVYKYPKVRDVTAKNDIDPEKILDSEGTLYIVAPQYEQEKYQPLFEALIMSMVRTVQNKAMTDKPLDKSLLLALDEAGNVAPLKELGHIASMMRSNNLRLITVFQDWSQLESTYHKEAGTIVNAHLTKMILAGLSDVPTLENLSKLLGETEVKQKSTTKQKGSKEGGSSVTQGTQFRPLLTPDMLRRFPYGQAVSIMADRHPTRMNLRLAYKEKDLLNKSGVLFEAKNHTSPSQSTPETPSK